MFERFTDRARQVVVLAQEEARLLDHAYIGTEHVLLGLVREGAGVGARALELCGVTLDGVRTQVEATVERGLSAPAGHIPFTPNAKRVLELSLREALQLGHNFIGTEHILLGLLRERDSVAARVLDACGVDRARVGDVVMDLLSGDASDPEPTAPPAGRWELAQSTVLAAGFGPRPAACSFCGVPSPVVGRLFTGNGGALICERCAGSIVAGSGSSRGPGSAERSFRVERAEPLTQRGLQVTPPPRQGFVPPSGPHPLEPPFDALAARFDPTGPPPTDEVGARSEIASAFADLHERTADGRGLVNVEHGDELAGYAAVVEDGLRLMTPATVNVVEHVRFVDASHAVVWLTTMLLDGRPLMGPIRRRECRAVLVDGRWKVAYESVRELWALANVSIPPRDDDA